MRFYWHWQNKELIVLPQITSKFKEIHNRHTGTEIGNDFLRKRHPTLMVNSRSPSHDDVIKWKRFPRHWPFVRGIHWSPVNSPHKGQWHGALNKRLSKPSRRRWFETPSHSLWRHCNALVVIRSRPLFVIYGHPIFNGVALTLQRWYDTSMAIPTNAASPYPEPVVFQWQSCGNPVCLALRPQCTLECHWRKTCW